MTFHTVRQTYTVIESLISVLFFEVFPPVLLVSTIIITMHCSYKHSVIGSL